MQRTQQLEFHVLKCSSLPKIWLFVSLFSVCFPFFPYFFHISIFLWGNWKKMSWDRVFVMCQESKFSAAGKRRTICYF